MRFKVGDRVIDTATGQRATVHIAERFASGHGEGYVLFLEDGRVVCRGVKELAPDAPPTAA